MKNKNMTEDIAAKARALKKRSGDKHREVSERSGEPTSKNAGQGNPAPASKNKPKQP